MSVSLYDTSVVPIKSGLANLSNWLTKAQKHAEANNVPLSTFLEARLAEDMLPFTKQVQIACDTAKFIMVRVGGVENKPFADTETTFEQLQERIAGTLAFINGVDREAFNAPDILTKSIELHGRKFEGSLDYLNRFALPNFSFHIVTAYALLRHKGVPLGKLDFLLGENAPAPSASK